MHAKGPGRAVEAGALYAGAHRPRAGGENSVGMFGRKMGLSQNGVGFLLVSLENDPTKGPLPRTRHTQLRLNNQLSVSLVKRKAKRSCSKNTRSNMSEQ